jgi:hypothetical protein
MAVSNTEHLSLTTTTSHIAERALLLPVGPQFFFGRSFKVQTQQPGEGVVSASRLTLERSERSKNKILKTHPKPPRFQNNLKQTLVQEKKARYFCRR